MWSQCRPLHRSLWELQLLELQILTFDSMCRILRGLIYVASEPADCTRDHDWHHSSFCPCAGVLQTLGEESQLLSLCMPEGVGKQLPLVISAGNAYVYEEPCMCYLSLLLSKASAATQAS